MCSSSYCRSVNFNRKIGNYRTRLSLEFWFSSPSRKILTSLSVSDTDFFSSHYLKKFRQTSLVDNGEGFAVHSSTWPSGAIGESAADWRYQTHAKKYDIFLRVLLWLFSGLEIPVKYIVYMIKTVRGVIYI